MFSSQRLLPQLWTARTTSGLMIALGTILLGAFFNVVVPSLIYAANRRTGTIAIVDATWLTVVFTGVVLYYFYLFVLSRRWRSPMQQQRDVYEPHFVLVVPARNEEEVIEKTLESLLALDYNGPFRVLVMNDGSTDRTRELAEKYVSTGKLALVNRDAAIAGRGKGDVLNHAYKVILEWNLPPEDTIVTILDADGRLDPNALSVIAPYFISPQIGSVQVAVRIYNARESLLTRLQDLEFVGFSMFMQMARDALGSVGLGGNGQFVRLTALQSLGSLPWSRCLTEDLDIGIRLALKGWKLRFCAQVFVAQHGVLSYKALLKQRTRWMQGTFQCWQHLPALVRIKGLNRSMQTDFTGFLLMASFIFLAGINLAMIGIAFAGVSFSNAILSFLASSSLPAFYTVSVVLSFGPMSLFLATYARKCRDSPPPACAFLLPAAFMVFTYAAWLPAGIRALSNIARNKTGWVKTPRNQQA